MILVEMHGEPHSSVPHTQPFSKPSTVQSVAVDFCYLLVISLVSVLFNNDV